MIYFKRKMGNTKFIRILDYQNKQAYNSYYCITLILEGKLRKQRNKNFTYVER